MAVPSVPQITSPADGAVVSGVVSVEWSESVFPFSDTFDRADSTTALGTSDSGHAWTAVAGTWGIDTNEAYSVSDVSLNLASAPTDLADGDGTFQCTLRGDHSASNYRLATLVFRYVDANNFLYVQLYNGTVELYKRDGGAFTKLAGAAVTLSDGTDYVVKVVAAGDALEVFVDGVSKITHTLSAADQTQYGGATRVGMFLAKSGSPTVDARWDDFTATQ